MTRFGCSARFLLVLAGLIQLGDNARCVSARATHLPLRPCGASAAATLRIPSINCPRIERSGRQEPLDVVNRGTTRRLHRLVPFCLDSKHSIEPSTGLGGCGLRFGMLRGGASSPYWRASSKSDAARHLGIEHLQGCRCPPWISSSWAISGEPFQNPKLPLVPGASPDFYIAGAARRTERPEARLLSHGHSPWPAAK
jgi:hypothetical protein